MQLYYKAGFIKFIPEFHSVYLISYDEKRCRNVFENHCHESYLKHCIFANELEWMPKYTRYQKVFWVEFKLWYRKILHYVLAYTEPIFWLPTSAFRSACFSNGNATLNYPKFWVQRSRTQIHGGGCSGKVSLFLLNMFLSEHGRRIAEYRFIHMYRLKHVADMSFFVLKSKSDFHECEHHAIVTLILFCMNRLRVYQNLYNYSYYFFLIYGILGLGCWIEFWGSGILVDGVRLVMCGLLNDLG